MTQSTGAPPSNASAPQPEADPVGDVLADVSTPAGRRQLLQQVRSWQSRNDNEAEQ